MTNMVRKTILAGVCCALGTGAGLLNVRADVTLPPPEADLMLGPPQGNVYCIDGVCTPVRITNGFHPTRWRKWPIVPPGAAPRGAREGISPPSVDVPGPDVEAEIPGRAGMPQGQQRSAPPSGETESTEPDLGSPNRGPREPSTSPTLPVEPREPEMPPELSPEEFRGRSQPPERGRQPQLQRDGRSPRRMPPVATRMLNRQASLAETLRGEATEEEEDTTGDELPSVRSVPKPVSRPSEDLHPSAATPNPTPWQGTKPPRTTPLDDRPPAEQPRAGSAFQSKPAASAARGGVRSASANVSPGESRVVRASAATLAVRPKIRDTWESDLVPANPLRARENGAQRQREVMQTGGDAFQTGDASSNSSVDSDDSASRISPAAVKHDLTSEAHSGFAFRNPLRK
jgi:hypothetical protein